jgi:hypothetical protein
MNRNMVVLALYIGAVYFLFVIVSALVAITRGNPALVNRKIKLGAMLVSLMPMVWGCSPNSSQNPTGVTSVPPGQVTCYDVIVPIDNHSIKLDDSLVQNGMVTINTTRPKSLTGSATGTEFSFRVVDTAGNNLVKNDIAADDGAFTSSGERFTIPAGSYMSGLLPGKYQMQFFACSAAEQGSDYLPLAIYQINVSEPGVMCYMPPPIILNNISLDDSLVSNGEVTIDYTHPRPLTGFATGASFSYRITDTSGHVFAKNEILTEAGANGSPYQRFTIPSDVFTPLLIPGKCRLELFTCPVAVQGINNQAAKAYSVRITQPIIMCYVMVPIGPELHIDSTQIKMNVITVVRSECPDIKASILYPDADPVFSFRIVDGANQQVQSGAIPAADGDWNTISESIRIPVSGVLAEGVYTIEFFKVPVALQPSNNYWVRYQLRIESGSTSVIR